VLSCFERILVRFDDDKEEFLSLGLQDKKIIVTGDCKIDAILSRKNETLLKAPDLKRALYIDDNNIPLFLAGSTHDGEDEVVLDAFAEVRKTCPEARLVLVPRHPERAPSIAALSEPRYRTALFSSLTPEWDVLVVDKIGMLFELYALVDAAFIGGSLGQHGGQNPAESALFGIQTTHGPDMRDFPDAARMDSVAASQAVHNASDLAQSWLLALTAAEKLRARAASVAALSETNYKTTLFSNIKPEWDVLVVDKIGVLFELYALVDAAFIGGTLGRRGGQNPTEAALFGIQTTHGPDMHDFPDAARMDSVAASQAVHNASDLAQSWLLALTAAEKLRARAACEKYFSSIGGAARRTFDVIKEYI
jgi:3-deoxy-D-manno-octulosonic-acid transferase